MGIQTLQHHAQAHIALLKIGYGGHDLLEGGVISGLIQLLGQIRQLLGVGGVMAYHVLHQGSQPLHGGVLTGSGAAAAAVTAVVGVGMPFAFGMKLGMVVGVDVVMLMNVFVLVGVGDTVVGVLVGMGVGVLMVMSAHMVVIQMNNDFSFSEF